MLLYGLVCTRLQHSKNINSCIASRWKSNSDKKTLLLLKWSLHSIIHRKYKTHGTDISSKVCGCYMARLTLSKKSNSTSLTILLYRLFTLLSTDGDNNNAAVIMELLFCFVVMPEWYLKSNISFRSFSYLLQWSKKCTVVSMCWAAQHVLLPCNIFSWSHEKKQFSLRQRQNYLLYMQSLPVSCRLI